jgi:hypothetical protein
LECTFKWWTSTKLVWTKYQFFSFYYFQTTGSQRRRKGTNSPPPPSWWHAQDAPRPAHGEPAAQAQPLAVVPVQAPGAPLRRDHRPIDCRLWQQVPFWRLRRWRRWHWGGAPVVAGATQRVRHPMELVTHPAPWQVHPQHGGPELLVRPLWPQVGVGAPRSEAPTSSSSCGGHILLIPLSHLFFLLEQWLYLLRRSGLLSPSLALLHSYLGSLQKTKGPSFSVIWALFPYFVCLWVWGYVWDRGFLINCKLRWFSLVNFEEIIRSLLFNLSMLTGQPQFLQIVGSDIRTVFTLAYVTLCVTTSQSTFIKVLIEN